MWAVGASHLSSPAFEMELLFGFGFGCCSVQTSNVACREKIAAVPVLAPTLLASSDGHSLRQCRFPEDELEGTSGSKEVTRRGERKDSDPGRPQLSAFGLPPVPPLRAAKVYNEEPVCMRSRVESKALDANVPHYVVGRSESKGSLGKRSCPTPCTSSPCSSAGRAGSYRSKASTTASIRAFSPFNHMKQAMSSFGSRRSQASSSGSSSSLDLGAHLQKEEHSPIQIKVRTRKDESYRQKIQLPKAGSLRARRRLTALGVDTNVERSTLSPDELIMPDSVREPDQDARNYAEDDYRYR